MRAILYRNSKQWRLEVDSKNGIPPRNEMGYANNTDYITVNGLKSLYTKPIIELFKDLHNSLYVVAFRNALNIGSMDRYYDIEIGQAFIKKWRQIKTGNSAKDNEAAFRLTEDIKHIFNFEQLEINPSDDDQTLQIFINGRSYKLFEVGSGLAQFILVLVNAAVKKPSYIFIDEPELNLHPSLQLDFLTTLGSYAQRGVFFATHNIGLARAVGDQIYAVRKSNNNYSEVKPLESISRLSEFLGELSFSGYREIGFSTVLLVEGSTEVKTIQQFLRKIKKDHEVVMVPLGGSQLINPDREIELAELTRISAKFYGLIDSEKDSKDTPLSEKRQGFVNICEQLEIQCKVLERRSTENYLTEHAIKDVLGQKYRALGPYESVTKIEMGWSKSDNWRIARRMEFKDIVNTDLGLFLKSL